AGFLPHDRDRLRRRLRRRGARDQRRARLQPRPQPQVRAAADRSQGPRARYGGFLRARREGGSPRIGKRDHAMIGAVDIGNTRTKLALFRDDGTLAGEKILATGDPITGPAGALFTGMLDRAVIGSVVPAQTPLWADFLMARSNLLHVAGHDSPWGFRVAVEN